MDLNCKSLKKNHWKTKKDNASPKTSLTLFIFYNSSACQQDVICDPCSEDAQNCHKTAKRHQLLFYFVLGALYL